MEQITVKLGQMQAQYNRNYNKSENVNHDNNELHISTAVKCDAHKPCLARLASPQGCVMFNIGFRQCNVTADLQTYMCVCMSNEASQHACLCVGA